MSPVNDESKWALWSKTVWGGVLPGVAQMLESLGIISPAEISEMFDAGVILTSLGLVVAGRLAAKQPIHVTPKWIIKLLKAF